MEPAGKETPPRLAPECLRLRPARRTRASLRFSLLHCNCFQPAAPVRLAAVPRSRPLLRGVSANNCLCPVQSVFQLAGHAAALHRLAARCSSTVFVHPLQPHAGVAAALPRLAAALCFSDPCPGRHHTCAARLSAHDLCTAVCACGLPPGRCRGCRPVVQPLLILQCPTRPLVSASRPTICKQQGLHACFATCQ